MQNDKKGPGSRGGILAAVIIIAAAAVASIALFKTGKEAPPVATTEAPPAAKPAAPTVATAAAAPKASAPVNMDKLKWLETPRPVPATPFTDAAGAPHTLADFAGKVLVVNFWATWCGPCVEEMPTQDSLQADLGGDKFTVVTINQDREGLKVAEPFVKTNGWKNLTLYLEPTSHFAKDAALRGLPTSLIVDREGREVARLEGTMTWNAPEVQAELRKLIDKP